MQERRKSHMKSIEEIRRGLDGLEQAVRELDKGPPVDQAEIDELMGRIEALRADLRRLSPQESWDTAGGRDGPLRQFRSATGAYHGPRTESVKKPKQRRRTWDEKALGKYAVGVLASVLVLLAAAVLLTAVWNVVPDGVKFALLMLAGAGLCDAGVVMRLHGKWGKPFWTCVAALGLGLCFLDITGGALFWDIYGGYDFMAGICYLIWFFTALKIAGRMDSLSFQCVTYAGGLIALALALSGTDGFAAELQASVMTACMAAPGVKSMLEGRRTGWGARVQVLFCIMAGGMFLWYRQPHSEQGSWVLLYTGAVLAGLALYRAPDLWPEGRYKNVFDTVLCGAASLWAAGYTSRAVVSPVNGLELVAFFLAMAVIACVVFLRREAYPCYLPGAALAACMLAGDMPGVLVYVLSGAMFFVFAAAFGRNIKIQVRVGLYILLAFAVTWAGDMPGYLLDAETLLPVSYGIPMALVRPLLAGSIVMSAAGAVLGYFAARGGFAWKKPAESVVMIGAAGLFAGRLMEFFDVSYAFAVWPAAVLLLYHKWLAMRRDRSCDTAAARVLWTAFAGMACVYVQTGWMAAHFMKSAGGFDGTLSAAVLLAFTASSVASALLSGSMARCAWAVVMANWTAYFAACMENGLSGMAFSLLGITLAAGFVALGFYKKTRNLRLSGLGVLILYVMKLSLFDIRQSGSSIGMAAGLLLGGLVCFGVSFGYNYLDRKYGIEDKTTGKEENNEN